MAKQTTTTEAEKTPKPDPTRPLNLTPKKVKIDFDRETPARQHLTWGSLQQGWQAFKNTR